MYLWTKNNREGLCDSNYDVQAVAATAAAVKLTACTNKYDRRRCSAVRQTIDCTVVFYFVHKTKKTAHRMMSSRNDIIA